MIYIGKGGLKYNLETNPFNSGGEGSIYNIIGQPKLVAKIYKPNKLTAEKEKKLVRMVDFPPEKSVLSQIAWPQDILYDNTGSFVGFVMPKLDIYEELNVIYEPGSSAKYPDMLWENRLTIAKNLCAVLNSVHTAGHTCGDLNPQNISVDPNTGTIVFLDTDSYHIQDGTNTYRCDVGIPEYLPFEIQVKMRGGSDLASAELPTFSQDTDNFALAIHIFQLLMNGTHPFACTIIPSQVSITKPEPSDNIIKGEFPFMKSIPGVKIPAYAPKIDILPKEIQNLFKRAFIDGHLNPKVRPSTVEWHKALRNLHNELRTCNTVSHHQYYKSLSNCPWCEVNRVFTQAITPKSTLSQTNIKPPPIQPPRYTAPKKSGSSKARNGAIVALVIVALVIGFLFFTNFISTGDNNGSNGNVPYNAMPTSTPTNPPPSNSGDNINTSGSGSSSSSNGGGSGGGSSGTSSTPTPTPTLPPSTPLSFGTTVQGSITTTTNSTRYRVVLTEPGKLTVSVTKDSVNGPSYLTIRWFNSDGVRIGNNEGYYLSSAYSGSINLEAGTYYIEISEYSDYSSTYRGVYSLTTAFIKT